MRTTTQRAYTLIDTHEHYV